MADAGLADDRLPWLENPRPNKAKRSGAARRSRTPLFVLLGLLLAGTVAVMAFLAGRGSGPFEAEPSAADAPAAATPQAPAPSAAPQTVPQPAEPAPLVPPPPTLSPPAPVAEPVQAPRAAAPAKARREASARPAARSTGVQIHRRRSRAVTAPPRYRWPAASAQPSGRVVQLGAYYNGRQTMAAWRRLRRAYPYLATLPRKVTVVRPGPGHPHYYRLRIGAQSAAHARSICDNLHRIGRGCTVV